jgi:hypothetical protein
VSNVCFSFSPFKRNFEENFRKEEKKIEEE